MSVCNHAPMCPRLPPSKRGTTGCICIAPHALLVVPSSSASPPAHLLACLQEVRWAVGHELLATGQHASPVTVRRWVGGLVQSVGARVHVYVLHSISPFFVVPDRLHFRAGLLQRTRFLLAFVMRSCFLLALVVFPWPCSAFCALPTLAAHMCAGPLVRTCSGPALLCHVQACSCL